MGDHNHDAAEVGDKLFLQPSFLPFRRIRGSLSREIEETHGARVCEKKKKKEW
jgi:hypothetical protein